MRTDTVDIVQEAAKFFRDAITKPEGISHGKISIEFTFTDGVCSLIRKINEMTEKPSSRKHK